MADISKITLPSGNTYDVKDATARDLIAGLNSFQYMVSTNAANTPAGVTWDSGGTTITGTLAAAADTMYKIYLVPSTNGEKDIFDEYLTINTTGTTYVWEMFGNTDITSGDLGNLAYADTASASYTPSGTVSQPTFTGTQGSVSVSGIPSGTITVEIGTATPQSKTTYTPNGTVSQPTFTGTQGNVSVSGTPSGSVAISTEATGTANYTPAGSVSAPTISVSSAGATGTVKNPTAVTVAKAIATAAPGATAPANAVTYYAVNNETLSLYQIGYTTGDSITTSDVTVKTGDATYTATAPTFTGTGAVLKATFTGSATTSTGNFTPSGTVSQPSFTGVEKEISAKFSGKSTTSTGDFTPAGSVSQPTFSGTTSTITVNPDA